jgi:hypothetical protein
VKGSVYLTGDFSAQGAVRLPGAHIGGELDCSGASFVNPPGKGVPHSGLALEARGIDVSGYVFLRSIKAVGQVQFLNAQIGRNLECNGGTIVNPIQKDLPGSGVAFLADDLTVKGSLFFSDGFKANGEVRLLDAHVGGTFGCEGGGFTNLSREDLPGSSRALSADRIHVGGSVFLGRGVTAIGEVRLPRAEIGGQLACNEGDFQRATVDLTDVSAGTLYDDRARWPAEGKLLLDGFTYGRINAPRGIDVSQRLAWLALQPSNPFPPRPYLQLAKVLRESGDDNGAQRVLIEMEHRRWRNSMWGPVLEWTIGYGYDPLRAFWWAAGLSAVGWVLYRRAYRSGGMVPSEKDAYAELCGGKPLPPHYPAFSPLVYSVENSLPLVKLGQADKWQPDPQPGRASKRKRTSWKRWVPSANARSLLRCFLLLQIVMGWLLATLFLAGVSGIVHKP